MSRQTAPVSRLRQRRLPATPRGTRRPRRASHQHRAAQYKRDIRNHLLPEFGPYRVDDIDVERIERFRDKLTADGLSNDTVRRIVTTLGYTLKLARKWRLIAHNPVSDADKPGNTTEETHAPESSGRRTSREGNAEPRDVGTRSLRRLLRRAEVRMLRPSLDRRRSRAAQRDSPDRSAVLQRRARRGNEDLASARETLLAPRAARALHELSVAQQVDARPNPHGLVFPSPRGSYWRDSNFDRRIWQKARSKAKLPDLTFHTLRYFYISMVRAQGLPTALTEQLVGHVDERTHRGYTRPIPGTEPLIRAALAAAFESPKKSRP